MPEVTSRELDVATLELANLLLSSGNWPLDRIDLDTQAVYVTIDGERFKVELTHLPLAP